MKHIIISITLCILSVFCFAQEQCRWIEIINNTAYMAVYSSENQTIEIHKGKKNKSKFTVINKAIIDTNELDLSQGQNNIILRYNEFDSTFYIIGANTASGQKFIVHAKDPSKKWSKPVFLTNSRIGTDPSIFWDKDGACYLQCTSDNNIIQIVMDPITGEELSSFHYLTTGLDGHQIKSPYIYRNEDNYFLIFSNDKNITTLRSDDIWGPFTPTKNNYCKYFQF